MSWLFSQALVAEYSAASSLDGEQSAQLSVMPTQHKFWRNDKTMEFSRLSQFGLKLNLLTESHGAELLTSYLAAFPVRTSVQPGLVEDLSARKAGFGQKWLELWARYDRASSSWKTAQCLLFEDLGLSLETWPTWGMTHDGACFQLAPLVHHTHERDCFYWHTPTANDNKPAGQAEMGEVQKWLEGAAVKNTYIRLRSLLAARCGRREPPNPPFLEWLMGWPIGWTEAAPLAMDKFQSWQQQHSVCSQKEPELSEA